MQPFYYIALLFLCDFSFLPSVLSIRCSDSQYTWPVDQPKLCCDKCPPGEHLLRRPADTCGTECKPCTGDRYTDSYNVQMDCDVCRSCNKENMEPESQCSVTRNAVCRCKAGFKCRDKQCTQCIPVPTTTSKPTLPPSTTAFKPSASTIFAPSPAPVKDTMWYLVIIALLCVGLVLIVISKLKPILCWIRSKRGYILTEKPTALPGNATDDEGVSKPVQEMCGKCEQPIEV
ncbi:CD27 antigen [Thunnus thynnus]|uniref:CD27 antigen n=1 Tax=Thunnus thynnus TaxID=8237 RepID=UPI003527D9CF